MSWAAKLIKKQFINGTITVIVEYTDGKDTFNETYSSPLSSFDLRSIVKNKIGILSNLDTKFAGMSIGNIDISDSIITPAEPSPEEEYQTKKFELEVAKRDLELGLITKEDYDKILAETLLLKDK